MMDIEAIKTESKEHSANPSDWSTDALLKEFLWALHNYYTCPYTCMEKPLERVTIAQKELKNRIFFLEKDEDREKGYDLVVNLMKTQMNLTLGKYASKDKRNNYVSDLCHLLNIRGAMSNLMLP